MSDQFYYVDDQRIDLVPSTTYVAFDLDETADREAIMSAVSAADGLMQPEDVDVIEPYEIVLSPTRQSAGEDVVAASIKSMTSTEGVGSTYPVFQVPGGDLRFQNLLLKAFGDRSRYSYRWRANWSYTYWRPSRPITSPADAPTGALGTNGVEETVEQEAELFMDSEENTQLPNVTVEMPSDEMKGTPTMRPDDDASSIQVSGTRPLTINVD